MSKSVEFSDSSDDEFPALDVLLRRENTKPRTDDPAGSQVQHGAVNSAVKKTKKPLGVVRRRRLDGNVDSLLSQPFVPTGARKATTAQDKALGVCGLGLAIGTRESRAPKRLGTTGANRSGARPNAADVASHHVVPEQDSASWDESDGRVSRDGERHSSVSVVGRHLQSTKETFSSPRDRHLGGDLGLSSALATNSSPQKRVTATAGALVDQFGNAEATRQDWKSRDQKGVQVLVNGGPKGKAHRPGTGVPFPPGEEAGTAQTQQRVMSPSPRQTALTQGGLASPKKITRIPATPHRDSSDMFWSREFVDDWNDEHSPKKLLFPDAAARSGRESPSRGPHGVADVRRSRKAFEENKHQTASEFLRELDAVITGGKISSLAAETGGVQLQWTGKLYTTAGRASWKKETVRSKSAESGEESARQRHYASIELADKIIDNEDRLLNVIAHEFCHLANFMISGVTTNPHGAEFKAWATKCSASFGHRGIKVTTKHSYDIEFKYVWECTDCAMEYKRHSKSINTERHRCGRCKGALAQTRPAPRARGKTSSYQQFMKEHMKIVKEQNPKSPQKEIMRLVAEKWSQHKTQTDAEGKPEALDSLEQLADVLRSITIREAL